MKLPTPQRDAIRAVCNDFRDRMLGRSAGVQIRVSPGSRNSFLVTAVQYGRRTLRSWVTTCTRVSVGGQTEVIWERRDDSGPTT